MHRHTFVQTWTFASTHAHTDIHYKRTYSGEHQSSYLVVEALSTLAARRRVRLSIFCLRRNDGSALRAAIEGTRGSNFRDVSSMHTEAIAQGINAAGVHVLIDMDAHFRNSRLELMAYKSAPVSRGLLYVCLSCISPMSMHGLLLTHNTRMSSC
jgi:hypothetical protein